MATEILDLTSVPLFDKATYIKAGKTYPDKCTPPEVLWERDRILKMPTAAHDSVIPPNTLSVTQFLAYRLPEQGCEFITTKTTTWFSDDKPTFDPLLILERPIPPKNFLDNLWQKFGQAWFNGAKSIVDPRYNNGMDRYPFWVITLWSEMAEVVEKQNGWRKALQWLEGEAKLKKDPLTLQELESVTKRLDTLGWNAPIKYTSVITTTKP